jgi:hypothetical protein
LHQKLNYLASVCAPDYSPAGYMRGNLISLTVGGWCYEQIGIMKGLNLEIPQDSPWEIGIPDSLVGGVLGSDEEGTAIQTDSSVKELPMIIKVTGFSFVPIHNFVPRVQQNKFSTGQLVAGGGNFIEAYGPEHYIALAGAGGYSNYGTNTGLVEKNNINYTPTSIRTAEVDAEFAEINRQIARIKGNRGLSTLGITGYLSQNEVGEAVFNPSTDYKPILNFPYKPDVDGEGCIIQYQPPFKMERVIPKDLYFICVDPYAIDKDKTNTDVTLDGSQRVITVDGTVPTPFHVSVTAAEVLKNCWSKPNIAFSESISANDTDLVLKVNGGRYKVWKKTFVGFNKDTEHNQQGAKLNIAEILGYQSAVKSKLWEYIFKILGGEKGNSVTGLMKYMPIMPDMTKSYTDDEWFTAFNITLKMQDDINQYLKDYK